MPHALTAFYGGGLGFAEPCLYANFVASLDGVTALDTARPSGSNISGGSIADKCLMGLLRACADAVMIGAGTLRAHRRHVWTADRVCPGLASEYAELRARLRRDRSPRLVVVSATGQLDPEQAAVQAGALVLTTDGGARLLAGRLPASCTVVALGDRLDISHAVDAVRAEGHRSILTEGGAHLLGSIVGADLLDEMFLTVSPMLAGRTDGDGRPGLVAGVQLAPHRARWAELLSARRHDDHLFLRYRLRRPAEAEPRARAARRSEP